MPELPEVETVRRRLEELLRGEEIREVELRCSNLRSPIPSGLTELLNRSRVSAVGRQGKYLLIHLTCGTWLVHLGMSGRFLFGTPGSAKDAKHDHLVLRMSNGLTVRYNDFRRFGTFAICSSEALGAHPTLSRLGVDALSTELHGERLFELLKNKKTPIKTSLLDQSLISGIGNMYACEILYWSDIQPGRQSGSLSRSETEKLARAIHEVLSAAVESGGSTLPDYEGTTGALGSFHHRFAVFGRHDLRCPRCESPCVLKCLLSGRTTYYCPTQQR